MKAVMRNKGELKDSGIEWVGKVPRNWSICRLKHVLKEPLQYGANAVGINYNEQLPRYVRITDISTDGSLKNNNMQSLPLDVAEPYILESGDVLFARSGATVGKAYIYRECDGRCAFAGYLIRAKCKSMLIARMLYYYTMSSSYEIWKNGIFNQATIQNIGADKYCNLTLILPEDTIEQQAMVDYLDDRCSKIDAIIAEAEASIEEYKDLKISMVNDAITHGIKGNADTDSDVNWIGKIPANWRITILKRLFKIKKNIAGKEGYTVLSITQRGIIPKNFKESGQFAADYSNYQLVDKGDFAMNHMDLLTGWVDISEYDGVTSPDYRVFVPTGYEDIYKPYYKYVLQNCYSCKIFYGLGHGVAGFGRWRLPKDMFLNFKVPLPPIDEQKEIASYLNNNLQKLDGLILTKQSLIEDLEAYKKSLIYEVVTGKRKVVA